MRPSASRANALRVNGRVEEALDEISVSADLFETRLAKTPGDARLQQQLATIQIQRGVTQLLLGREAEALSSNARAIQLFDALLAADAANVRAQSLLSFVLLRQAPVLQRSGRAADAAASTRRGLAMLQAQADRPGASAGAMNDYASWLLTCEPASLRDPVTALRFAGRAADVQRQPMILDTLALALFQTGDVRQAIDVAIRARRWCPPAARRPGHRPARRDRGSSRTVHHRRRQPLTAPAARVRIDARPGRPAGPSGTVV